MATEIQAPQKWPDGYFTLFLAGAIDQGIAPDWQKTICQSLSDYDVVLLNPRRDDWDSSWEAEVENPQFVEQVAWESRGLDEADFRVFAIFKDSKAPITLLELGKHLDDPGCLMVEEGFYREGNVEFEAITHTLPVTRTLEDLVTYLKVMLDEKGLRRAPQKASELAEQPDKKAASAGSIAGSNPAKSTKYAAHLPDTLPVKPQPQDIKASVFCVACESGDCFPHAKTASIVCVACESGDCFAHSICVTASKTASGLRQQIEQIQADMMKDVDDAFDSGAIEETGNPWGNCTTGAEHIIELVGQGDIFGYMKANNPTAELADGPECEGGHDFAIIGDLIADFWAMDYKGTPGIIPLSDHALITKLYGDPYTWQKREGGNRRLAPGEGVPAQLLNPTAKQAAKKCNCGHSWDEHVHMADFGCKHESEGCGCLGFDDGNQVISKKGSATREQMIAEAEVYAEPSEVDVYALDWKDEPHFNLSLLHDFCDEINVKWLVQDLWERLGDTSDTREEAKGYYDDLRTAIKNGTVDPILVVQRTDGTFHLLDGNHRSAMALFDGITHLPAWVGYQKTSDQAVPTAKSLTEDAQ